MQSKLNKLHADCGYPLTAGHWLRESEDAPSIPGHNGFQDTLQKNQFRGRVSTSENWRLQRQTPVAGERASKPPPELEQALYQAHKLETLAQMSDGLAHNLNNLLQGALSAMNLIHRRIDPRHAREIDFLIGHAFASVEGVAALTRRLLDFSRPRLPNARPIDLTAQIVGMKDLLNCALLPRFTLKVDVGEGPMRTTCDPHALEKTILDLVINAREAMPGGGTITIKTGFADLALERPGLPRGDYVSVCVGDHGQGMAPDVLARVFDPLFTTKKMGHRVGLGLPLAELFAERSHGYIDVESVVGEGTHAWLYLPRDADQGCV